MTCDTRRTVSGLHLHFAFEAIALCRCRRPNADQRAQHIIYLFDDRVDDGLDWSCGINGVRKGKGWYKRKKNGRGLLTS